MLYTFTVVKASTAAFEADHAYFNVLRVNAQRVCALNTLSLRDAWQACEYLDSVDAGDLSMERELYNRVANLLGQFLETHANEKNVDALCEKSWAAQTLREVLEKAKPVVRLDRIRRAA